jgi:ABC-2 type transport system permease protein
MLKSVFGKTLYEKRWTIIGWTVAMVAFTLMIVLLFPIFKDTFGQALKDVPESMKSLLGNAETYQTLSGYLDVQLINQMVFLPVILGIVLFSGLIAGSEDKGTLQTLLAQPVKRSRVYLDMLGAGALILAIVTVAMFIATWLSAVIIGENFGVWRFLQACVSFWLVSMLISLVGYAIGAVGGKRGFAGMITGLFFFLGYLITNLAPTVKAFKYPNYLSPFKYFNTPSVMQNGLRWSNIAVMVVASLILIGVGFVNFVKRDINQK